MIVRDSSIGLVALAAVVVALSVHGCDRSARAQGHPSGDTVAPAAPTIDDSSPGIGGDEAQDDGSDQKDETLEAPNPEELDDDEESEDQDWEPPSGGSMPEPPDYLNPQETKHV